MHIRLIGGIGPAATDFYYRRLIAAFASRKTPLEPTIAHADTAKASPRWGNGFIENSANQVCCAENAPGSIDGSSEGLTSSKLDQIDHLGLI